MNKPHPAIVLAMSPALCPILPASTETARPEDAPAQQRRRRGFGTVPAEPKAGQRIVMERFDKFFLPGKPYLDKVVVNLSPTRRA